MFLSALLATFAAWLGLTATIVRICLAVRHTSLVVAYRWLVAAGFAVSFMATTDMLLQWWPGRTAGYGWFLTAILLLCPPIAVLGSRRPGVRLWSAFILLPMVVVLSWPVWTMLLQSGEARGMALETPTILGFGFVLLMGAGNYFGTRFAFPCLLYVAATAILFATCTGWQSLSDWTILVGRRIAIGVLAGSVLIALRLPLHSPRIHRINRLWYDFKTLFGNVWALRMVERINSLAVQEHWTARISYDGFPETADGRLADNESEIESACRWLFRRFVDDQWVEQRLGNIAQKRPVN